MSAVPSSEPAVYVPLGSREYMVTAPAYDSPKSAVWPSVFVAVAIWIAPPLPIGSHALVESSALSTRPVSLLDAEEHANEHVARGGRSDARMTMLERFCMRGLSRAAHRRACRPNADGSAHAELG